MATFDWSEDGITWSSGNNISVTMAETTYSQNVNATVKAIRVRMVGGTGGMYLQQFKAWN